jgi:hypothetical protein
VVDVDDDGRIVTISYTGSGIVNNYIFPLSPYLYNATNIWDVSVTVNGILQRPFIDYDFNSDSALYNLDLVFNAVPPAGATIVATTTTQFSYVDILSVDGLAPNARFGATVSQTDNGRMILVGAVFDDSDSVDTTGAVYAFDRGVIKYIVSDTSETTFALPAGFYEPVAVLL